MGPPLVSSDFDSEGGSWREIVWFQAFKRLENSPTPLFSAKQVQIMRNFKFVHVEVRFEHSTVKTLEPQAIRRVWGQTISLAKRGEVKPTFRHFSGFRESEDKSDSFLRPFLGILAKKKRSQTHFSLLSPFLRLFCQISEIGGLTSSPPFYLWFEVLLSRQFLQPCGRH